MRAMLEIKSVSRGKSGDTIKLIEEPIDRLPPKIELRGGERDGQEASAKSMRFDKEAGTLTLCNGKTGEEVFCQEGELTLTDSWVIDKDSGEPAGSCKWAFGCDQLDAAVIGGLFESAALRADFKPAQRKLDFSDGETAAAKELVDGMAEAGGGSISAGGKTVEIPPKKKGKKDEAA